jgi:aerobic carbon-monoxide dehydrogenase medium subunit
VKPAPFIYLAPESTDEALRALSEYGADGKILAGGQSLVPMMNMRLARPSVLIDVTRIRELAGLRLAQNTSIGATTRQREVLADPTLAASFPLLHEALKHVGHTANRARGTIGGSIAHADPAAELPAVMLALKAQMMVRGQAGSRLIDAEDFFVTYYTTDLDVDDLLVEIRLPASRPSVWGFREVARRHGDFALAGVVFTAEVDADGVIGASRVVMFGVTDRPIRASAVEQALCGRRLPQDGIARDVAQLAPDGVDFTSDIHVPGTYRRDASRVLVERAIADAVTRMGVE